MKIVHTNRTFLAGKNIIGVAFWPFVFIKTEYKGVKSLLQHESIHAKQQLECLLLPFFLLYIGFYLYNRMKGMDHEKAYRAIPFEKEAYHHELTKKYLENRKPFAWAREFM